MEGLFPERARILRNSPGTVGEANAPATDADLQAYKEANQGLLADAKNWVADNWEYLAAAGMVIASGGTGAFITRKFAGSSVISRATTGYSNRFMRAGSGSVSGADPGAVMGYQPQWLTHHQSSTFRHHLYRSGYMTKNETLYRAGDTGAKKEFGSFWSYDAPQSVMQVRNDKAILPVWSDGGTSPISMGYEAKFAPGTTKYSGLVAPQQYEGVVYPGGTNQVLIEESWEHGEITNS